MMVVLVSLLLVLPAPACAEISPTGFRLRGPVFGWKHTETPTKFDRGNMNSLPIRVAHQGEPGDCSEKSTKELLGEDVIAVGKPSVEACFHAVDSNECDYACLPIENYDLVLEHDLRIIAEHVSRASHCLLVKQGVKRDDIKYAIAHPQALAQCANFLRDLGITPINTYDTGGAARMIAEGAKLPLDCTPENTAAIGSDLAGKRYGLDCLHAAIEDDDTHPTRFLLLGRKDLPQHLAKKSVPTKTSVLFTLPNKTSALYNALACFATRDIDFTKIESRPTSAWMLSVLKAQHQLCGESEASVPSRNRCCFFLDCLAGSLDANLQNALAHLREQSQFVRMLGSYPQASKLSERPGTLSPGPGRDDVVPLRIGVVGFDASGQVLARQLSNKHHVSFMDPRQEVMGKGVDHFSIFEVHQFLSGVDVVVLTSPLVLFEETVVNALANRPEIDIVSARFDTMNLSSECTNDPLSSGRMVFEKMRVSNAAQCERLMQILQEAVESASAAAKQENVNKEQSLPATVASNNGISAMISSDVWDWGFVFIFIISQILTIAIMHVSG